MSLWCMVLFHLCTIAVANNVTRLRHRSIENKYHVFVNNSAVTKNAAAGNCGRLVGGSLASIANKAELTSLHIMLNNTAMTTGSLFGMFWIGAHFESLPQWQWLDGGDYNSGNVE